MLWPTGRARQEPGRSSSLVEFGARSRHPTAPADPCGTAWGGIPWTALSFAQMSRSPEAGSPLLGMLFLLGGIVGGVVLFLVTRPSRERKRPQEPPPPSPRPASLPPPRIYFLSSLADPIPTERRNPCPALRASAPSRSFPR